MKRRNFLKTLLAAPAIPLVGKAVEAEPVPEPEPANMGMEDVGGGWKRVWFDLSDGYTGGAYVKPAEGSKANAIAFTKPAEPVAGYDASAFAGVNVAKPISPSKENISKVIDEWDLANGSQIEFVPSITMEPAS